MPFNSCIPQRKFNLAAHAIHNGLCVGIPVIADAPALVVVFNERDFCVVASEWSTGKGKNEFCIFLKCRSEFSAPGFVFAHVMAFIMNYHYFQTSAESCENIWLRVNSLVCGDDAVKACRGLPIAVFEQIQVNAMIGGFLYPLLA